MEGFIVKLNPQKRRAREIMKRASIVLFAVFVLVLSSAFDNIDRVSADTGTTISSVTVGNAAPSLSGVVLKKGQAAGTIVLAEGTTVVVNVVGIITDTNGDADITSATATIYRTSVSGAEACSANDANCYIDSSCTLDTADGDNDRNATCTVSLQYFADLTDDDGEIWTGFISATDGTDFGTGTATEEVATLQALDAGATIAYGTLSTGVTTTVANDVLMQVTTSGNQAIDVTIQATAATGEADMCDGADCTSGNEIAACQQQYTTNTTIEYNDLTDTFEPIFELSSTSARAFNLESVTPTTATYTNHDNTDDVFWKIGIPSGAAAATFSGTTTITSTLDLSNTDNVDETLCN